MHEGSKQISSSVTIMVVEPEVIARASISEFLRGCGYKVIEGASSDEVFAVLNAGTTIDIVFTEVSLVDDLDGLELAKRIRERHSGIDVILAVGVANAAQKAGALCDDGPLEKPFHPQELLRRIHVLRERRRTTLSS
jgi:DNA-binding response OmpR family regulator